MLLPTVYYLIYKGGVTPKNAKSVFWVYVTCMCYEPIFMMKYGFPLPCGKCLGCAIDYSNHWTLRILHESQNFKDNCMITLTYAKTDGNLNKSDLQKFFKRLRKYLEPRKIRYFACGEYGGKGNRPHYHAIIFNWLPSDLKYFYEDNNGNKVYLSKELEKIWSLGFVSVTMLCKETVKYCTKYLTKLDKRFHDVQPFTTMSRKPGIGYNAICPDMILGDSIYIDGKRYKVPKYYLDKLEELGYNTDMIKASREFIAHEMEGATWQDREKTARERRESYKKMLKELNMHKR